MGHDSRENGFISGSGACLHLSVDLVESAKYWEENQEGLGVFGRLLSRDGLYSKGFFSFSRRLGRLFSTKRPGRRALRGCRYMSVFR